MHSVQPPPPHPLIPSPSHQPSLLSLQGACCWETCSLWPAFPSCHIEHATRHRPTASGRDWSMPQLQWQLVIPATSGRHSQGMNPMLKRPHTCNSPDTSCKTTFALINGSLVFIYSSPPWRATGKTWGHNECGLTMSIWVEGMNCTCTHFCSVNDLC